MSRTLARAATGACGALVLTAASVVVGGVSTASAADGCSVEYTVASDWGSGFTADVTVTNDSGGPVTGWTVEWTLPSGHTITNAWKRRVWMPSGWKNTKRRTNPTAGWLERKSSS